MSLHPLRRARHKGYRCLFLARAAPKYVADHLHCRCEKKVIMLRLTIKKKKKKEKDREKDLFIYRSIVHGLIVKSNDRKWKNVLLLRLLVYIYAIAYIIQLLILYVSHLYFFFVHLYQNSSRIRCYVQIYVLSMAVRKFHFCRRALKFSDSYNCVS